MDQLRYIKPDYPEDAFRGTALYYSNYRAPYPESLTDDLLGRTGANGDGRLLDLACGPGRIAIPFAPSFRDVWAIDREPEMIEVGQRVAQSKGVDNIKWMVGRAEDLAAQPASFQLITIGEAFHRLDQWLIARQASQWLAGGCCLAILGCYGVLGGPEPWKQLVADIAGKWSDRNSARRAGSDRPQPGSGPEHAERVLRDVGFSDVASYAFERRKDWTIESIIGYLYSTSVCSKKVLGESADAFEIDLRNALLAYNPNGHYREKMRCGYTLGRTPRS